jgi:hypothetical protein
MKSKLWSKSNGGNKPLSQAKMDRGGLTGHGSVVQYNVTRQCGSLNEHLLETQILLSWSFSHLCRVVIPGVRRLFGGRTGRAALSITPYMNWGGIIDREITIPNLLYCNNFSYYCPSTWSCGGWQSRWRPWKCAGARLTLQIYHGQSVNARLTLIGRVQRSIGHIGRPAPQTTLHSWPGLP